MRNTRLVKKAVEGQDFQNGKFSADGKSIFYLDVTKGSSDIWQLDLNSGKSIQVTNFNLEKIFNFTISRDGKKLYIVRGNTTDEVVLIKNVE